MSKPERSPTSDVVGEMATALSESTRYLVDKAESFNKSEASRLGRLVFCLIVANVTITLFLLLGAWVAWHEIQTLLDSHNSTTREALDANVAARLAESRINAIEAKQKAINETVYKRLNAQDEEILNGTRRP